VALSSEGPSHGDQGSTAPPGPRLAKRMAAASTTVIHCRLRAFVGSIPELDGLRMLLTEGEFPRLCRGGIHSFTCTAVPLSVSPQGFTKRRTAWMNIRASTTRNGNVSTT